ncbi:MAG TPA: alkaline phosphatase family protein [Bryobacteraceae bacterium]|nr:alkaline phosphatase family protein [Bryobacteraceae bacterium]
MDGRTNSLRKLALVTGLLALSGCARHSVVASGKKVIVLGIDGMDPNFLEQHWSSLPNLAKLAQQGEFKRLETTMPPQSPVAWSTFITGTDPGSHGIFDFVHRDPKTLAPYSSMAQSAEGAKTISMGDYELPISSGKVNNFRQGKPFWQMLAENHVAVQVIRMPTDFPPVHCDDGFSIAGMGTPDLRGTNGEFTFFTDEKSQNSRMVPGGRILHVDLRDGSADLEIPGPDNSLRKDKAPTFFRVVAHVDPKHPAARFDSGDTQVILKEGEWSDWIRARFTLIKGIESAGGIFRIYAKKLHPTFEVYVTPVNIDPSDPVLPITAPDSYSQTLAKEVGLFYTQGMAQDTAAWRQGVFDRAEYIAQSRMVSQDHLKLLRHEMERFHDGFLFFHFFGIDQDSHMLWGTYDDDLLETYKVVDQAIGWVQQKAPDATLIVMSDHGFTRFDRALHLNTWLMKEGFLTLDDPKNASDEELFPHVDWSKTQAYAVGLNGLYLNLQGREPQGVVAPGPEADALTKKLVAKLMEAKDPDNGKPMVGGVTVTHEEFHGNMLDKAPDLLVGYMPGYRGSWQTALGAVPKAVVEDNKEEWRADHCIWAKFVPGVLISNRKSADPHPHLWDLTVSLLATFNVGPGPGMIGHSIY